MGHVKCRCHQQSALTLSIRKNNCVILKKFEKVTGRCLFQRRFRRIGLQSGTVGKALRHSAAGFETREKQRTARHRSPRLASSPPDAASADIGRSRSDRDHRLNNLRSCAKTLNRCGAHTPGRCSTTFASPATTVRPNLLKTETIFYAVDTDILRIR